MYSRGVDVVRRVYKYRVYPTKEQRAGLKAQLFFCAELYNAAVEQRRTLWRQYGASISHKEQSRQLTELRRDHPELLPDGMSRSAMQKTLKRVDRAFRAFHRRVELGEKAGYPRYKGRDRVNTLQAQYRSGCKINIETSRLYWSGVGEIKVKLHRSLPDGARITEIQIKREAAGTEWYICLGIELPLPTPLEPTGNAVGVDLGISTFAALSNGQLVQGPRAQRGVEARVALLQRERARKTPHSNRYRKHCELLGRARVREARIRRDHHHKLARLLVRGNDLIVLEDLKVRQLAESRLAKDVRDQGWGQFARILADKAAEAGRLVLVVDPRGTSQECSSCARTVPKRLSVRIHACECGLVLDRDVNAARNILRRGERQREAAAPAVERGTTLCASDSTRV